MVTAVASSAVLVLALLCVDFAATMPFALTVTVTGTRVLVGLTEMR